VRKPTTRNSGLPGAGAGAGAGADAELALARSVPAPTGAASAPTRSAAAPADSALPDEVALTEMVELAELREWIEARIADLGRGVVDDRVLIPIADAAQTGAAMRLHLAGRTQRQIAAELGISLGLANKRIVEGTNYLILLQGIEQGIGVGS